MKKQNAELFFETVQADDVKRYAEYWESIKPVTHDDFLRRYLFAFTSVHTSWQGNINGYNAIKDLGWMNDKEDLRERLIRSRCGMFNHRTSFIWNFKEKFYKNPSFYCEIKGNWQTHRNRLVKDIVGIGMAKVSFTLEMCFPNEAKVTCIDTHGIQLYELPFLAFSSKKEVIAYEKAERHWVKWSEKKGASPTITRALYWDKKQKQPNSRYWTWVLESH